MDEFDARLKGRLLALAAAVPRVSAKRVAQDPHGIRRRGHTRTALPVGLAAIVGVIVLALIVMQLRPIPVPAATPSPTAAASHVVAEPSVCHGERISVRWFIGLGPGSQPNQIEAERRFVSGYNAKNSDCVALYLEIVPNAIAADTLKTEIASGNAPDVVGPIGASGRLAVNGLLLDLAPLVSSNHTDLSGFEPAVVNYLKQGSDGLIGLPYDIFPGYLFYNKDLFGQAGLPPLPTKVGERYMNQDWTWDELATVATRLTVDKTGKNASQIGFDARNIVRYGFDIGYADALRFASTFGGGSLVGPDGRTAQIPDAWAHAWTWYYDAMWTSHAAATDTFAHTLLLGPNSTLAAIGSAAMEPSWSWEIPSYGSLNGDGTSNARIRSWDIAVLPTYNGKTSSPLDVDAFVILKAGKNSGAAYKAMLAMMADPGLRAAYGGEPARFSDQAAYFADLDASLDKVFPGNKVNWSVIAEMSKHPAVPSHDSATLNPAGSKVVLSDFLVKLQRTPHLDINQALAQLKAALQVQYDILGPGAQ